MAGKRRFSDDPIHRLPACSKLCDNPTPQTRSPLNEDEWLKVAQLCNRGDLEKLMMTCKGMNNLVEQNITSMKRCSGPYSDAEINIEAPATHIVTRSKKRMLGPIPEENIVAICSIRCQHKRYVCEIVRDPQDNNFLLLHLNNGNCVGSFSDTILRYIEPCDFFFKCDIPILKEVSKMIPNDWYQRMSSALLSFSNISSTDVSEFYKKFKKLEYLDLVQRDKTDDKYSLRDLFDIHPIHHKMTFIFKRRTPYPVVPEEDIDYIIESSRKRSLALLNLETDDLYTIDQIIRIIKEGKFESEVELAFNHAKGTEEELSLWIRRMQQEGWLKSSYKKGDVIRRFGQSTEAKFQHEDVCYILTIENFAV